jgi:hypothetical protein
MAVRNGSEHDTEYETQQPMPLAGGQYIASTAQTVISIALIAGGVVLGIYNVMVEAGTVLDALAIGLVILGGVVEGYNLLMGPSRVAREIAGEPHLLVSLGRVLLKAHQEHPGVTFGANSIVVFYEPKAGPEQARTESPINNPNAEVVLLGTALRGGATPTFHVEVNP